MYILCLVGAILFSLFLFTAVPIAIMAAEESPMVLHISRIYEWTYRIMKVVLVLLLIWIAVFAIFSIVYLLIHPSESFS